MHHSKPFGGAKRAARNICEISGADGRPGVLLMKLSAITSAFCAALGAPLDVIINFLVLAGGALI
jgi:hypothetical protein